MILAILSYGWVGWPIDPKARAQDVFGRVYAVGFFLTKIKVVQ